jgi:FkbM family methyltransferase
MDSALRRVGRHVAKALLETALPPMERVTGFQTPRGGYLPNRIRMLTGRYEVEETNLMRRFLQPGQTIVDVGANVGYLTRFFARSTGPAGKVYAFEPNPIIFPLLEKNISGFRQVSLYNVGLSSNDARLPLFFAGDDHAVASFAKEYPATHVFYQKSGRLDSAVSELVAGDNFMNRIGVRRIDILKIDVEGWELNVLAGLERTISDSQGLTIFCEFNPTAQACAGRGKTELLDWFFDRQFTLAYPGRGELLTLARQSVGSWVDTHDPNGFSTLFAMRP